MPERLFRIRLVNDPYCQTCFEYDGALICDFEHLFCTCRRVSECWSIIRNIILNLLPGTPSDLTQNFNFISLLFNRNSYEKEIVWLIASYINEVWKIFNRNNEQNIQKEKFFGFLRYKYKKNQLGARLKLQEIPDIS